MENVWPYCDFYFTFSWNLSPIRRHCDYSFTSSYWLLCRCHEWNTIWTISSLTIKDIIIVFGEWFNTLEPLQQSFTLWHDRCCCSFRDAFLDDSSYELTRRTRQNQYGVRATKLVPHWYEKPYEERLKELKLPSLENCRKRGDMIQCYKIMNGLVRLEVSDLFICSTTANTRGHHKKVWRHRSHLASRKSHFLKNGEHLEKPTLNTSLMLPQSTPSINFSLKHHGSRTS